MGKLTLLIGGARSGKSSFAEEIAKRGGGEVLYLATAETLDEEMKARVQMHRSQRPDSWRTREVPLHLTQNLKDQPPRADYVILDCITLLVSNILLEYGGPEDEPDIDRAQEMINQELEALIALIAGGEASWVMVSNEVGLGLVPPYPLGRAYRDLLGRANRRLAFAADEIYFMTAGMILPLHELGQHIDQME